MAHQLRRQTAAVKAFFDSAAALAGASQLRSEHAAELLSQHSTPACVEALLAKFDSAHHAGLIGAVTMGASEYRRLHGFDVDPSFIEAALSNVTPRTLAELMPGSRFDSATNTHHDQLSLQPAQAIVAIMQQFAEAIPFAAYLPADVKSNEARLAIFDNKTGSDFGDYLTGASLNGVDSGGNYIDAERMIELTANGGAGPFTTTVTVRNGAAVSGSNPAVQLLRGRTMVFVNGTLAAREAEVQGGSGNNTIAGQCVVNSTTYTLTGTSNSDTGAISVTPSAALPAGTNVTVIAYIDMERQPGLAPKLSSEATIYKLYAHASRAISQVTIDASTQFAQEIALDPRGQQLMSLRSQYANERHYRALAKMKLISANLVDDWNFDRTTQIAQKDLAQLWLNLAPVLGGLSQKMANATNDHGITTLYVTGELAAQARGLPSTIWESSGVTDRPGIYRLGRLFGKYDLYYTPKGITETGGGATSEILCLGRASQVARNPLVVGDAVAPTFIPLAVNSDLVQGDGFYTRNFTEVNPHAPSALGAARIRVTNIK